MGFNSGFKGLNYALYWNGRLRSIILSTLELVKKKREELGLKYKKMYWLMGKRSALSIHNKPMLY